MDGYEICECGKFAFIYKAGIIKLLPKGYDGELCPECNLWVCAVDKLNGAKTCSVQSAKVISTSCRMASGNAWDVVTKRQR